MRCKAAVLRLDRLGDAPVFEDRPKVVHKRVVRLGRDYEHGALASATCRAGKCAKHRALQAVACALAHERLAVVTLLVEGRATKDDHRAACALCEAGPKPLGNGRPPWVKEHARLCLGHVRRHSCSCGSRL